jgi:hypothetical protein
MGVLGDSEATAGVVDLSRQIISVVATFGRF